jgi:hypothetical protein
MPRRKPTTRAATLPANLANHCATPSHRAAIPRIAPTP